MSRDFFSEKVSKSSVGLLVIALLVGGLSAQATGVLNSPSGGYLICVDSKTKVVTHPGTTSCPKGSKKLVIGAVGKDGAPGIAGAAGLNGVDGKDGKTLWNGVIDPESTLGVPGDMFINSVTKTLFGPKDLTTGWPVGVSMVGPKGEQGSIGLTGATGPQGPGGSGPAGPAGPAGTNGTGGSSAPVATGTNCIGTKCTYKIGDTGPGGGLIFFVDYNDQYTGLDYLEAAPTSCEGASKTWSSADTVVTAVQGWAARAVGAGPANTTAIQAIFTTDTSANNAAYFASSCAAGGKSDWFLGSVGEMKLMYDNLPGVGGFVFSGYWTSNDSNTRFAWFQDFARGEQTTFYKNYLYNVRPVRAF